MNWVWERSRYGWGPMLFCKTTPTCDNSIFENRGVYDVHLTSTKSARQFCAPKAGACLMDPANIPQKDIGIYTVKSILQSLGRQSAGKKLTY